VLAPLSDRPSKGTKTLVLSAALVAAVSRDRSTITDADDKIVRTGECTNWDKFLEGNGLPGTRALFIRRLQIYLYSIHFYPHLSWKLDNERRTNVQKYIVTRC